MSGDRLTDAELAKWGELLGTAAPEAELQILAHARWLLRKLLQEVRERRAEDSKRGWLDAGAPMLGEDEHWSKPMFAELRAAEDEPK